MWRRWMAILLAAVLLLVLLAGGGLLFLRTRSAREQVRAFLEQTLARELNLPVHLGRFSVSLSPGSVELRDLAIIEPTSKLPLLRVDRLRMGLKLIALLRGELRITSVVVSGPRLSVEEPSQLRSLFAGAAGGARGRSRDRPAIGFPVLIEQGAIVYRSPSSKVNFQVDGLHASLTWPALDGSIVAVTADTVRAGVGEGGLGGMRLEARGQLGRDLVEVERLTLLKGESSLSFAGVIGIAGDRPRVEVTTTGEMVLEDLASLPGRDERWGGKLSVSGKLLSEQFPQAFEIILGLVARDQRMVGSLEARVHNDLLTVDRLFLKRGMGWLTVRGNANLTTAALGLTTELTMADFSKDLRPREAKGLGGRLALSGRVVGTFSQPIFTGRLRAENVRFKGWHADLIDGPVEVGLARVASRALRIRSEHTAATLSGEARLADQDLPWSRWRENLRMAAKLDLKGRIENLVAWSQPDWPVAGPIDLRAQLAGTVSSLEGGGQLEMQKVKIGTEEFEALRATIVFKGAELTIPRLTARLGGIRIHAEGAIAVGGRYRFSILPVRLDLASISSMAALGGKGTLAIWLSGEGQWPERRVEGRITLTDVILRDSKIGSGSGRFALDGTRWRWELSVDQRVSARGVAPLSLSGPLQAEVTVTDLDLAPFLRDVPKGLRFPLWARADGRASLHARLPDFRDLEGWIDLAALRGQAGPVPWRSREPTRLVLEAGMLRIESLGLAGPGLSVIVKGSVRPGERVELSLSGRAPFELFAPWVSALSDLQGNPEVWLSIVGPRGEVKVNGRADLSGVEGKIVPLSIRISVRSGEARFDNAGVQYAIIQGTAAGGRLQGQGKTWREEGRWRHTVDLMLDRAQMEQIYEQLQSERRWASGELTTSGSLAFDTTPGQPAVRSLSGRLSVALEGGSLSRYPGLVRIFGLLGSPVQLYRLPDLTRDRMPYRRISAEFTVKDGVMETQDLLLDSEVVLVSGVGKVKLADQRVDLDLGVRPLQVLERGTRKIPLLGRILPQEQSLAVVYFTMDGPWHDPTVSVASVKSLRQTVTDNLLLILRAPERIIRPGR